MTNISLEIIRLLSSFFIFILTYTIEISEMNYRIKLILNSHMIEINLKIISKNFRLKKIFSFKYYYNIYF